MPSCGSSTPGILLQIRLRWPIHPGVMCRRSASLGRTRAARTTVSTHPFLGRARRETDDGLLSLGTFEKRKRSDRPRQRITSVNCMRALRFDVSMKEPIVGDPDLRANFSLIL